MPPDNKASPKLVEWMMNYSYMKQAKSRRPGRAPQPSVSANDEQYDRPRAEEPAVVNGNGSGYMSESEKYGT